MIFQKWYFMMHFTVQRCVGDDIYACIRLQELHLNAAMKVMDMREPPLQKDDPNPNLTQWLNHIRLSRTAIESILGLKCSSEMILKVR